MDFTEEVKALSDFQNEAQYIIEFLQATIDDSWREIMEKQSFDSEKLSQHERMVSTFERFKEKFAGLDDVLESFEYYSDS